LDLTSVSGR